MGRVNRALVVIVMLALVGTGLFAGPFGVLAKPKVAAVDFENASIVESEGRAARVVLRWDRVPRKKASIRVRTVDRSAIAGVDYEAVNKIVKLPRKQKWIAIEIPLIADDANEPDEEFDVELGPDVRRTTVGRVGRTTVTIKDDEAPPALSISDPASVREGDRSTFDVSLSSDHWQEVTVNFHTEAPPAGAGVGVPGSDYEARSGLLTFDPGETELSVDVQTLTDGLAETDEVFAVKLSTPVNAVIADSMGVGTIRDRLPTPVVSLQDAPLTTEGQLAAFEVSLSRPVEEDDTVTVSLAAVNGTADGSDLSAPPTSITFNPGDSSRSVGVQTVDDAFREIAETFELRLTSATGAIVADDRASATIEDNDPCGVLTGFNRDRLLDSFLSGLEPEADADGDGFTNGEELGALAFDPIADPTRFNPLIADAPKIDFEVNGDLALALHDKISETDEDTVVTISENERLTADTDEQIEATIEGYEVGAGGGAEEGKPSATANFSYSNQTLNQQTTTFTKGTRELERTELQERTSLGREVEGGEIDVTATLRNVGNVAYRIEDIHMNLRFTNEDGSLGAFSAFAKPFEFGQGPTLASGDTADVLFTIQGIGAADTLSLINDSSGLVIGLANVELAEIGIGQRDIGAGNFAQYKDSIRQNTAAMTVDLGSEPEVFGDEDLVDHPAGKYFVSTTFRRDASGRPVGTTLCDALGILLGRDYSVADDVSVSDNNGGTTEVEALTAVSDDPATTSRSLASNPDQTAIWTTNVTPASVGFTPDPYNLHDVLLRAGHAAEVLYYKDTDGDKVEHRIEANRSIFDTDVDSDDDGLDDHAEIYEGWQVAALGQLRARMLSEYADPMTCAIGGNAVDTLREGYVVLSDPSDGDFDGDGLNDTSEKDATTDPFDKDTDADGTEDDDDPNNGSRSGATAQYFSPTGNPDPLVARLEDRIGFTTLQIPAVDPSDYKVRWTAAITPSAHGNYKFGVDRGGVVITVNGVPFTTTASERFTGEFNYSGTPLTVSVEYPSPQSFDLRYQLNEGPADTVPSSWFAASATIPLHDAWGLGGDYRADSGVDFDSEVPRVRTLDRIVRLETSGSPFTQRLPKNNFKVRWKGFITVPESGDYRFGARHDGAMTTKVGADPDSVVVFSAGGPNDDVQLGTSTFEFDGDVRAPYQMDLHDLGGDTLAEPWVRTPNGETVVVPKCWFTPDASITHTQGTFLPNPIDLKVYGVTGLRVSVSITSDDSGDCSAELNGITGQNPNFTCDIPSDATGVRIDAHVISCESGKCDADIAIEWPRPGNICYDLKGDDIKFDSDPWSTGGECTPDNDDD